MKAYTIQFANGEYLKHGGHWNWISPHKTITVKDPDKAKHYKTIGPAKGQLTMHQNYLVERVKNLTETTNPNLITRWQTQRSRSQWRKEMGISLVEIKKIHVVELDVVSPNFRERKPIRFDDGYRSCCEIKKTAGNRCCGSCGLILQNVPHQKFGKGQVCPWCMLERVGEAQKIIDGMDESWRDELEAERFVHRMG
jgi:hypothetical protein